MRKRFSALVLLVAMFLAACSTGGVSPRMLTGEAIDALGKQFLETGQLYDRLYDAKKISKDEYAAWARFSKDFPVALRAAYTAWKSGQTDTNVDMVLQLKNQLRDFLIIALERSS